MPAEVHGTTTTTTYSQTAAAQPVQGGAVEESHTVVNVPESANEASKGEKPAEGTNPPPEKTFLETSEEEEESSESGLGSWFWVLLISMHVILIFLICFVLKRAPKGQGMVVHPELGMVVTRFPQ